MEIDSKTGEPRKDTYSQRLVIDDPIDVDLLRCALHGALIGDVEAGETCWTLLGGLDVVTRNSIGLDLQVTYTGWLPMQRGS